MWCVMIVKKSQEKGKLGMKLYSFFQNEFFDIIFLNEFQMLQQV